MNDSQVEATETTRDPLVDALRWKAEGREVVLATVISTWGSSPRPVGSQLAADDTGRFSGSVSGGCVESALLEEAAAVRASGTPKRVAFGVTNEMAWEVGLSCGGRIEVYLERLD